jgi:hypothetical protein
MEMMKEIKDRKRERERGVRGGGLTYFKERQMVVCFVRLDFNISFYMF